MEPAMIKLDELVSPSKKIFKYMGKYSISARYRKNIWASDLNT